MVITRSKTQEERKSSTKRRLLDDEDNLFFDEESSDEEDQSRPLSRNLRSNKKTEKPPRVDPKRRTRRIKKAYKDQDDETEELSSSDDHDDMNLSFDEEESAPPRINTEDHDEHDQSKTFSELPPQQQEMNKPKTRSSARREQQKQSLPLPPQQASPIVISSSSSETESPGGPLNRKKRKIQSSQCFFNKRENAVHEWATEATKNYRKYRKEIVSYCQFVVNIYSVFQNIQQQHMTAQPQVSYSLIDFSRFLRKALNVPEIGSHCKCIPKKKVLHNAVFNVIGLLSQTISSGFDIVNEWKKVSSLKVKVSKDEFNSLALSLLCSRIPSIALSFVSPRTFSQAFKGLESEQNFYENNFFVEENPERDDLEKLFQVLSKLQPNLSNETMNEWKELILNPSPQNSQTCEDVILIEANMSSLPPSTKEAPTQESCQDTRTTGETEQTTHEQQPSRDSLFPMSQNQIELSQDPVLENSTPPSKTIPFGTGDINTPQQTLEEDEISYNFDEELEEEEDTSNNKLEQNSKKQKISVITSGSVKLREQRKFLKELKKIKKLKLKRRQTMFDTSTSENYHPTPGHQRRKTHHGKTDISKNQPLSKSIKEIVDKSDLIQVSSSTPSVHDFAVKEAIHKAAPEIIEVLKQYLNAFPSPNMDLVQVMSTIAQKLQNHPNFYHRLWNFLKTEDGSSSTPNPTQPPSSSTIEEPEY